MERVNRAKRLAEICKGGVKNSISSAATGMCATCIFQNSCEFNRFGNAPGRLAFELTRSIGCNNKFKHLKKVIKKVNEETDKILDEKTFNEQVPCEVALRGIRAVDALVKEKKAKDEENKKKSNIENVALW